MAYISPKHSHGSPKIKCFLRTLVRFCSVLNTVGKILANDNNEETKCLLNLLLLIELAVTHTHSQQLKDHFSSFGNTTKDAYILRSGWLLTGNQPKILNYVPLTGIWVVDVSEELLEMPPAMPALSFELSEFSV